MDFGFGSFFNFPPTPVIPLTCGNFFDTTTQTAVANTPTPFLCDGIDIQSNIGFDPTTGTISINDYGVYNLQFSAQIVRVPGTGGAQHNDIWVRKNGVDIAHTDRRTQVNTTSDPQVVSWNFLLELYPGDNVQLMYAVTNSDIRFRYSPPDLIIPNPEIPSVIISIYKVA